MAILIHGHVNHHVLMLLQVMYYKYKDYVLHNVHHLTLLIFHKDYVYKIVELVNMAIKFRDNVKYVQSHVLLV